MVMDRGVRGMEWGEGGGSGVEMEEEVEDGVGSWEVSDEMGRVRGEGWGVVGGWEVREGRGEGVRGRMEADSVMGA